VVAGLVEGDDFETDEYARNVFLSERGYDRMEAELGCGDLHTEDNFWLLTEISQALHARVLLHRDVDYILRNQTIELVDEFTGRAVPDRRWPDGLQAALEAKEGLEIRPGGQILSSIPLQHFLPRYRKLAGMTATAEPAVEELWEFYELLVVVIPPHRPCVRIDRTDLIFTHRDAKVAALVEEIRQIHELGRPVLVGTASVRESEELARALGDASVFAQVLNAKNDEEEARIVAQAGTLGAVTISTNMAGRGTDIRLGGPDEEGREELDELLRLGGLLVIGTNRHESKRIDDQLRGRTGRQGEPGESRFFICLEDGLMVRYGVDELLPPSLRPPRASDPIESALIRRQIERLQRIVEGQNLEIRRTLWQYTSGVRLHASGRVPQADRQGVLGARGRSRPTDRRDLRVSRGHGRRHRSVGRGVAGSFDHVDLSDQRSRPRWSGGHADRRRRFGRHRLRLCDDLAAAGGHGPLASAEAKGPQTFAQIGVFDISRQGLQSRFRLYLPKNGKLPVVFLLW
jgi:preprotein translocase subunit SecA